MASTYLSRTFGTPTNEYKWTFSAWVKRSGLGAGQIFAPRVDGNNTGVIGFNSSNALDIYDYRNAFNMRYITNRLFRDTSAWYHIVVSSDSTLSTPLTNIYINGVQETSFSTSNAFTQNQANTFNRANVPHYVGQAGNGSEYFDGSMSHINFVDGTAYDASAFGETDATTGIWKPKTAPSVTYGNNGLFLKFENSGSMGTDSSGQGNNFTVNGTMTQNIDTPSNVFAVLNTLDKNISNITLSNGNLTMTTSATNYGVRATMGVSSGKWYWEVKVVNKATLPSFGIAKSDWDLRYPGNTSTSIGYASNGEIYSAGNNEGAYGAAYTTGDIIGVALDMDSLTLTFYKNGVSQGAVSSVFTASDFIFPAFAGQTSDVLSINFGNGYFGTTAVSSAQNPDDGIGIFEYDVPAGYYALNTKAINAQEYD